VVECEAARIEVLLRDTWRAAMFSLRTCTAEVVPPAARAHRPHDEVTCRHRDLGDGNVTAAMENPKR
jgi:hypothetical protein